MVGREVGVEDLEGLDVVEVDLDVVLETVLVEFDTGLVDWPNVGLPVGVAGLLVGVAGLEAGPPELEGRRIPILDVFNPEDGTCCLDIIPFLFIASGWEFDSYNISKVNDIID
ncbi:hypothetical protein Hanom_Chr08g00712381 [Helianthus anomalus]